MFIFRLIEKRTKKIQAVKKMPDDVCGCVSRQLSGSFLPSVGALKFFKLLRDALAPRALGRCAPSAQTVKNFQALRLRHRPGGIFFKAEKVDPLAWHLIVAFNSFPIRRRKNSICEGPGRLPRSEILESFSPV